MDASKPSQDVQILKAVPEDALGINTVLYKTWLDTYPNAMIGITKDDIEETYKDSFTEERLQKHRDRIANGKENELRLVAKIGKKVVGVSRVIRQETYNQLQTIYVLPEFQGKGIGHMLWKEASKFCDPSKDTIVQVTAYTEKAISFYRKLGFKETDKRVLDENWEIKSGIVLPQIELVIKGS